MGTLSKLLVTHSGRPLEANAPRLISFKGLYKFFLQAEHARARAQYKREILSAFFADTALSEYRRRSVALRSVGIGRRHLGMALLTCTNSQTPNTSVERGGKASECICMWGRLGFKTCRKPHKRALHSIIFASTTGDYQETTEGAISHFVNGGGKNHGGSFSWGVVVC